MADQRVLSVRDLAVDFEGDAGVVNAVRGASFDLVAGRTLAVVGESGSGKSVTAQAILGILPKRGRIVRGSIQFADPEGGAPIDIAALPRDSDAMRALRGGRIAMIFQEPMTSLSPLHQIGDQIGEAYQLHHGGDAQTVADRTAQMLARVGFADPRAALKTYPFELSGGMRQRAMIAMALICNPAILIADEPTTALDVTTQAQILHLMRELQREFRMGMLLITHDLGVVANMADEVAVMYRGDVVERGPVEAIFRDARHPYLQALMRSVPRFAMKPGERLVPIREVSSGAVAPPAGGPARVAPGAPLLQVEDVSKRFILRAGWIGEAKTVTALNSVSLTLHAGRTLGIVGESGSGKTTLSKIIMRAMAPDEGRVLYDPGTGLCDLASLEGEALTAYRRAVQFVFQDPFSSLNPRMTVFDILSEPLIIHGIGNGDARFARVKTLMNLVGLDVRHLRRYPHSFSGGQRQRIGLARALALEPSVIICDEPTSALDVSVQAQVLNLLKDLQAALGLSLIFVSHNLAVVDYMADEVAVMCRGHVVEEASREQLFRNPRHPYTQALLAAVPDVDLARPLDFARLVAGGFSDPARWPAPYTIAPGTDRPTMIEAEPGHFVRIGGTSELRLAS